MRLWTGAGFDYESIKDEIITKFKKKKELSAKAQKEKQK